MVDVLAAIVYLTLTVGGAAAVVLASLWVTRKARLWRFRWYLAAVFVVACIAVYVMNGVLVRRADALKDCKGYCDVPDVFAYEVTAFFALGTALFALGGVFLGGPRPNRARPPHG